MKTKLVFLLALSVGVLGNLAVAQTGQGGYQTPQVQYALFHSDQDNVALQSVAWDHDRDRCDGDHDRDGRGCRWESGEHRYPVSSYGYTAYSGHYAQRGVYDRYGDFHPYGSKGYFDRYGYWHNGGRWWR
jgi:hypothetical protein